MQNVIRNLTIVLVTSGAIKTWQSGETIATSDLNANFSHIHNKMVGGHGARLVNADVVNNTLTGNKLVDYTLQNTQIADGGISSYKLVYGAGIAKSFVAIYGACNCAPVCACTMNNAYNMTSVSHTATGVYRVTWNWTATNTPMVLVSDNLTGVRCYAGTPTTTFVDVSCEDLDTPAATDSAFSIAVFEKF